MKLAVIGIENETIALAKAAVEEGGHEIVAVFDENQNGAKLAHIVPQLNVGDDWETLLVGDRVDAVIVAPGYELRADQLRKLAQQAIPMLLIQPVCDSLLAYELEMIRNDTDVKLVTYYPGCYHPAIKQLAQLVASESDCGVIEQLTFERGIKDRGRQAVRRQLARDVEMICRIIGPVNQVNALGSEDQAESLANISVQMSGLPGILARWSVSRSELPLEGKLVLAGTTGQATLFMPAEECDWRLEIKRGEQTRTVELKPPDSPLESLHCLAEVLAGGTPEVAWNDVARSLEISESVEESLRRGRTITLYDQQHSEQATFKGIMAVGGCSMLMFTLLAFVIALFVDGTQPPFRHQYWWRIWPVYITLPMAFFLLLQLFQLVFKRKAGEEGKPSHPYEAN